jgi:NitT/TauT family transport system substrate-binding protein
MPETLSRRVILQAVLAAPAILKSGSAVAQAMNIRFSLAAPFDGSNAAFFYGDSLGWYKEAGFNCQFDPGAGSGEAITRVGTGVYGLGVADINAMTEFNVKNPTSAVRNVYMLYFQSPLCVATLAKSGISKPSDLAGRKIGASANDGAFRLFSAYSKATGLDPASVNWSMVGLQLREALLSRGDVDAILGFDSTMYFGLVKSGIAPEDIKFLYYAQAGLDLYGNGIIVSDKLRKDNPEAVKRFVAVTARAWQAAAADPKAAVAALQKLHPLIDAKLEEDKLRWLVKNQLTTAESRASGLGAVQPERLTKALETLAATYGLPSTPKIEDVFDGSFLPSADLRKLPA